MIYCNSDSNWRVMMFRIILSIMLYITLEVFADNKHMVAFICNKPARYIVKGDWKSDADTDCLHRAKDILHYCRKIYPKVDVTNVMPSLDTVSIDNWCQFNGECISGHLKHTVRPYRCLSGNFESDALLVPDHCFFDHIESDNNKKCVSYDKWNITSQEACSQRSKQRQSFAPLRPCNIGMFAGVEYVCCPNQKGHHKKTHVTPMTPVVSTSMSSQEKKDTDDQKLTDHYLRHSSTRLNEHRYYVKAKKSLINHHKFKVTKMMSEWAQARQHLHDIKQNDPKGSDKLNEEITSRFQKAYEALEEEGQAELEQLNVVHQQRVQVKLNDRKKRAMEKYMTALTKSRPSEHQIISTLKKYISIEQKDRIHTVRRMRHVQSIDKPASKDMLSALRRHAATHLRILAQRIEQSIEMLTRVPQLESHIKKKIEKYLRSFNNIDSQVQKLLSKAAADDRRFSNHSVQKTKYIKKNIMHNSVKKHLKEKSIKISSKNQIRLNREKKIDLKPIQNHSTVFPKQLDSLNKVDDQLTEEHSKVHSLPSYSNVLSHAQASHSKIQQSVYSNKSGMSAGSPLTGTLGVVLFTVISMVVIIVGSLLLRKRRANDSTNGGFISVSQASPEDRHLNKMQANGYENPTYKYFEKSPSSSRADQPLIENSNTVVA